METLWAPWRMEYILGPKGGPCVLCDLARRGVDRDGLVLAASEHAFVCLNKFPFAAGHVMVVPKRHVADVTDLAPDENAALFAAVQDAVRRLRAATACHGVNVGMNLGELAGAGIAEHVHVHVVPRWKGDTSFMPLLAETRVMPEHLGATFARLAPHFDRGSGAP